MERRFLCASSRLCGANSLANWSGRWLRRSRAVLGCPCGSSVGRNRDDRKRGDRKRAEPGRSLIRRWQAGCLSAVRGIGLFLSPLFLSSVSVDIDKRYGLGRTWSQSTARDPTSVRNMESER